MTLGSNLADRTKESQISKKITIFVTCTRLGTFPSQFIRTYPPLVVLPLVGIPFVYALIKLNLLPDDIILHFLLMIQFSMPSAVNLILACQAAGGGEGKMSSLLFWQYVVCAFTISICCIIVQLILL